MALFSYTFICRGGQLAIHLTACPYVLKMESPDWVLNSPMDKWYAYRAGTEPRVEDHQYPDSAEVKPDNEVQ